MSCPINNSRRVITANINSTIKFPFRLERTNASCPASQDFVLSVEKVNKTSNTREHYCMILHRDGVCNTSSLSSRCECLDENGDYQFTKEHADMADNTDWVWSVSKGFAKEEKITFFITRPPVVESLIFFQNDRKVRTTAKRKKSLTAVCKVDLGNPPVEAHILNGRARIVKKKKPIRNTELRYKIERVSCRDAGIFRCEAPGATDNKTATLLVKCRPRFHNRHKHTYVAAGNKISLNVSTYTRTVTKCLLMKLPLPGKLWDCLGIYEWSGDPPDMVLTIRLHNLTKLDEGQWRLNLTNPVGEGQLDFYLRVVEPTTTTPHLMSTTPSGEATFSPTASYLRDDGPDIKSWMTSTSLAVVAVAAVVLVGCWLRRRKPGLERRTSMSERATLTLPSDIGSEREMPCNVMFDPSDECVMIPNLMYRGARQRGRITESLYSAVRDQIPANVMDIDRRPPAPLPGENSGDYAEVGADADETDAATDADDYVSVDDIKERKRQTTS